MSEQVKAALIISVGIVVAVFVYMAMSEYNSPYQRCLRSYPEEVTTLLGGGTVPYCRGFLSAN